MRSFLEEDNEADTSPITYAPQDSYGDLDFMEGSPPLIEAEVAPQQAFLSSRHPFNQHHDHHDDDEQRHVRIGKRRSPDNTSGVTEQRESSARIIAVQFSPCVPQSDCVFYITKRGITSRE
jgi:hypothetical protein